MNSVRTFAIAMCFVALSFSTVIGQDSDRIFYVKVNKSTELQGQIVEVTELKVSTSFGEVDIPFEKVEAIKMRAGGDGTAVIAFINGDMVTGKIQMDELQIKTSWGKAYINADSIDSIAGSQFGNFYADPNGGWRYSRGSRPNSSPVNRNRGFSNPGGSGFRGTANPGFNNPSSR